MLLNSAFNSSYVVLNNSSNLRLIAVWCRPVNENLKFNVDELARGFMDSNMAEVHAVKNALKFFSSSRWNGRYKLVIESDSTVALAWINDRKSRPWK
ncbi:hypothetical protein REPUB_Repub03eG0110600 [Reevesia pubescens]